MDNKFSRRSFLYSVSMLAARAAMPIPVNAFDLRQKLRVVLVGTGVRRTAFSEKRVVEQYPDLLEFVGLSDINPGRLSFAKEFMGVSCPVFTDFDEMIKKTKPELIIVTTKDSNHHEFIIKGLEANIDVLTEK